MRRKYSLKLPHLLVAVMLAAVLSQLMLSYLLYRAPDDGSGLQGVKRGAVLRVLSRNTSTSCFDHHDSPAGPEYDLVKGFADSLGVRVKVIVKDSIPELIDALYQGEGDLVAAGITRTEERDAAHRFGPDYQTIQQQVLCRDGIGPVEAPGDLAGRRIAVISGSSYEETLRRWQRNDPGVAWTTSGYQTTDQIIESVDAGEIDCTIADSNIVAVNQRFYRGIRVAFAASEPHRVISMIPISICAARLAPVRRMPGRRSMCPAPAGSPSIRPTAASAVST